MGPPPDRIAEAPVVSYAVIDRECRATANCRHWQGDQLLGPAAGLLICRSGDAFFLYACNERWEPETDTWHETVEDAKEQAEFEYQGIRLKWQNTPAARS
jgi:hypothetical protein